MDLSILGQFEVSGVYMIIPIILITLNAGLKKIFSMASKYAILINWIGGVVLAIGLKPESTPVMVAAIIGYFAGSSASGLYDGLKQYLKDGEVVIPPVEQ